MLSCTCPDWENDEPGSWWFYEPDRFSTFSAERRERCSSCNKLIDIGGDCLEFRRERTPYTEIEERIKGDEIGMASLFMCKACGEIYLNLTDLGYCLEITESMRAYMSEYHEIAGFKPK